MNLLISSTQDFQNSTEIPWEDEKKAVHKSYLIGARSIQFIMCSLFAGIVINFGSKKYHYPFTVGCFIFGVIVGLFDVYSEFVRNFTVVTRMDPSDMMLTFLPILIFESSFGMDAHMFYRALSQCVLLALPGLVLCTILTGVFAKYVLTSYNWSWFTAFLFGSIVSATDPVAVVALLKEMRMPHSFTILIEGESLLNDGVAIVLYDTLSLHVFSTSPLSIKDSVIELLKTCIGAPIFGYVSAKLAELILARIYVSPVSEMSVIFLQAYITYFVAERFLGVSAVLAVVLFGVTLNANKMCISPESESLIQTDWRLLAVYANTLIFVIVGVLVSVHLSQEYSSEDAYFVFLTFIALTLFRGIMILLFYPVLKSTGYGLNWKEGVVLAWGGLRGGVGLALALMFVSKPRHDASENINKVLVQVAGIIILTLIINANTVKLVMKLIRFKDVTLVHRLSMGNAIACVTEIRHKSIRICKSDWRYKKADWTWLLQKTKLHDPYKGGLYGDDPSMCSLFIPYGTCDECMVSLMPYSPSDQEMRDLNEAARGKVLRAMKGFLWRQFRNGLIQRRALKFLSTAVDNACDTPKKYLKAKDVSSKFMRSRRFYRWLVKNVSKSLERIELQESPYEREIKQLRIKHRRGFRKLCSVFYFSWMFEPLIIAVILLNVAQVVIDVHLLRMQQKMMLLIPIYISSIFFIVFYILEIVIKVVTLRWHRYIKNPWNKFHFTASMIAVIAGIVDFVLFFHYLSSPVFLTYIRLVIALRVIGIYQVLRVLYFNFLSLVRNYYSKEFYYEYDVGRGFLFANQAVLKKIEAIVDFGPCVKIPLTICEENILHMLDNLTEFEEEFPAIAFALQSNRAARRILNRVQIVLDRFKEKSLILKEDIIILKKILFEMTKKVAYAPRIRPVIHDISKILEESDWIRFSDASKIILENHTICSYRRGEVIHKVGKHHQWVHIIASGIVKVLWNNAESKTSPHQMYNKLPNTDTLLFFDLKDEKEIWDFLVTSQTLGLLGYLQKTKSITTAVCEKDCELIQINYAFLKNAEEEYHFNYAMWRMVAINVGVSVLKQQPRYTDYSDDDIKMRLQKGIMPSLLKINHWKVPEVIDDVVLIQGRVKDSENAIKFIGPAYIPNTCKKIIVLDNIDKRPQVIMILLPTEEYNFKLCRHWTNPAEISSSGLCSLHFAGVQTL